MQSITEVSQSAEVGRSLLLHIPTSEYECPNAATKAFHIATRQILSKGPDLVASIPIDSSAKSVTGFPQLAALLKGHLVSLGRHGRQVVHNRSGRPGFGPNGANDYFPAIADGNWSPAPPMSRRGRATLEKEV